MNEEIKTVIEKIISYKPQDLKREHGDFQFTDVSKEIDSICQFVNELNTNRSFIDELPDNLLNSLRNSLNNTERIFSQISTFKPQDLSNPQSVRDSFANQIKGSYNELYDHINKLDVFSLKTSGKQGVFSNLTKEAKQTLQAVKNSYSEIQNLLETSKKTASKIPLYEYLGVFSQAATRHKISAICFGIASFLSALILSLIVFKISEDLSIIIPKLKSTQEVFGILFTKLFFLAIIIYILQQFVRNYMANMHQYILNKHRENCLRVFDAMSRTATTKDTSDQVLSYLAKSIFESGETGFFPGKDISKDGPDIVQIFKDIGKPK